MINTATPEHRHAHTLFFGGAIVLLCAALIAAACILGGCSSATNESESSTETTSETSADTNTSGTEGDDTSVVPGTSDTTIDEDPATRILNEMTLEEKVLQMFIIEPEDLTGIGTVIQAGDTTREALEQWPVGGLIYHDYNLIDADQTTEMLANTQSYSKYGLFLAVDEEGGSLVARVANNPGFSVEQFPDMIEIGNSGDTEEAYRVGSTIGDYLRDLGFTMDFAPIADVLTDPNNTAIGARSFGSDPYVDSEMVAQVVRGFNDSNMISVTKHFPGHGGTTDDSHDDMVVNYRTLDEMKSCEFLPFEAAIDAGAPCIMIGHISVPEVTGTDTPATLSYKVVTGILRDELGFDGVVVTDSMGMGAITNFYTSAEASVLAIQAGCDIILSPADFQAAYQGVLDAIATGELTEERIDESVLRILNCKLAYGIIE